MKKSNLVALLERWTELDVRYFLRGGAVLFSTQFILILSSFLLSVGFAHLTSKELFGQFQFVLAVLGTLSVLSLPGANTAVLLGVSQNKDGTLLQGVKLKFKWSILGILGLLVTAGYFYIRPSYESLWQVFLICMIFFPILYSIDVTHSFFAGRKKFSWSCGFQLITEAGSAIAALISLFFTKNLLFIVGIYLLVQAIGDLLAFSFARKRMLNQRKDPEFNLYSFQLTLINFIPYIKTFFDKIVVTYFLGFAATAIYTIGAAIAEQLYAVSKSVSMLVFPKLAEQKKGTLDFAVRKRIGLMFFFFIIVAGIGALLAPIIIPFFFSEQYSGAVLIAQLLLLVSIPRAVAFVLTKVQEVQREKQKLYRINAIYAGTEIIALIALTPFYGMYGIVGAKALSNVVYLISAWRSLR